MAVFLPALLLAEEPGVPAADYPKAILGKWDIRTYTYVFEPSGNYHIDNPDDETVLKSGSWKLDGLQLSLANEDGSKQTAEISFPSYDLFVWQVSKDRPWEAERIKNQPKNSSNADPSLVSADEPKSDTLNYSGTWISTEGQDSVLTHKFQNTSSKRIKAFRGILEIKNDFEEVSGRHDFEFTSATLYANAEERSKGHIIESDEIIYFNTYSLKDGSEVSYATNHNGVLEKLQIGKKDNKIQESDIAAQYKANPKKVTFVFDKIVFAD